MSLILRATLALGLFGAVYAAVPQDEKPPLEKPVQLAEGVWIRPSNLIGKYGSNVGWIEFKDFVVVVDAAFPAGAEEALGHIKATTGGKPIRYVIVTHYHGDHAMGTGVFAKEGAIIVSHANARADFLKKNVDAYAKTAQRDADYRKYELAAPTLTFTDVLAIDDGRRRAEVRFFGHAHTTGCVWTWLPAEKILFTGDACVNGPFNYMGDSDSASWIKALEQAEALKPEKIGPGHGAPAGADLLATQKRYFVELREQVGRLVADGKSIEDAKTAVDIPAWKAWTGQSKMNVANIEHVYRELKR
ncbi:MAG TPA: MBL fold metallo-hydrolase [Planctomycetota bacterium]|nr:MBL fold metallo-hydrolase [Planctomycetota bacterium]